MRDRSTSAPSRAVACIDVGGTAIKSGLLDGERLVHATETPTGDSGQGVVDRVLDAVVDQVARIRGVSTIEAVGLVVPGMVDTAAGVGIWSENLGWRDAPFRDLLHERVRLPVAFGHDVRAGALAEARLGAGAGASRVVVVAVGTGIASAYVANGVLDDTAHPSGEIGHLDVGTGLPCVCGLTGCLETVASAAAVARHYSQRVGRDVSAAGVAAAVATSDPIAREVWGEAIAGLGRALSWISAIQAPDVITIGGGLARAGDLLLDPLREDLARRLSFHHRPRLLPSRLGGFAGCIGAGLLAQRLLEPAP